MRDPRSIILTIASISLGFAGCAPPGGFKFTFVPRDQSLEARTVERSNWYVWNRVAVIDISGVLMNSDTPGLFAQGDNPVSLAVEKLREAAEDSRVKAVVLRINSPGGTVTASDTLHDEIRRFKASSGKPVVAFFQDVAASGAYYLACATDEIIAQRSTVTGSIGVIMQMFDLSGTLVKIGVQTDAITSGEFKDSGSPLREMRPEERALFQGLVDGFYQQFVTVVDEGRPNLSREEVVKLADGRVYNAEQALVSGLVDRVGSLHDAIDRAKTLACIKKAHIILYHRPQDWKPTAYAQSPAPAGTVINFLNLNLPFFWTRHPEFLYIWSPG